MCSSDLAAMIGTSASSKVSNVLAACCSTALVAGISSTESACRSNPAENARSPRLCIQRGTVQRSQQPRDDDGVRQPHRGDDPETCAPPDSGRHCRASGMSYPEGIYGMSMNLTLPLPSRLQSLRGNAMWREWWLWAHDNQL